jgi:simple sugar transport system ATP-binding protein
MLIPALTVTENIILGLETVAGSPLPVHMLDVNRAEKRIEALSKKYGLEVNPRVKVYQLSVGERQRVEIIKALYRGVDILILDEPTSVLTPGEVMEMFEVLRSMVKQGLTIVFITHKLTEVVSLSDRVTVLRNGRVISTLETHHTNESKLARLMCGREVVFHLTKPPVKRGNPLLKVETLRAQNDRGLCALKDVSFSVFRGEILGIAGVAGNGQSELVEVITGLRKATRGRVFINGRDVTNRSPKEIIEQKVAHIPEDRLGTGIFMDLTVAENMILETHDKPPFAKGWFLNDQEIDTYAKKLISEFDIKTPNKDVRAELLSGGNLQKLILARELSRKPQLIIAVQPSAGLDCGAAEFIRLSLIKQRGKRKAILLISKDLEEIFSLSDRIAVMYEGERVGIIPAKKTNIEKVGLMMGGALKC